MGWARLAVTVTARTVLFSILSMLAWAILPAAIGWTTTTVMTGSMEPRIHPGDVVVSRPAQADAAALGHILLVDDPDHAGRLRLHRFAEFTADGNFILRGDANSANDSTPVAPSAVHGLATLRVPLVGLPVVWFAEKNWAPLGGTLAAVAVLTLAAASGSRHPAGDDVEKPSGTPRQQPPREHRKPRLRSRRRGRARARATNRARALLVLAALPLLAGLITSATAQAGFAAFAHTTPSSFSALANFPCRFANPADSPSFFYPLDEGSGTITADTSANKRAGKVNGTPSWGPGTCGANSRALTLTGKNDFISTGTTAAAAPNVFTAEIWFKTSSTSGGRLIGFGNGRTDFLQFTDRHLYVTDTGAITFGAATGRWGITPSTVTSGPGYNNNAWHLATATMSAAGTTLYIDATAVDSDPNLTAGGSYDGTWRVGYDAIDTTFVNWPNSAGNPFFAGAIDNAAVYPTALTPAQVKVHFDAAKPQ
jgi:signal peptidase I